MDALADPVSVDDWFAEHTHHWGDWSLPELMSSKAASGRTVSLVVPARNEAATVGAVVTRVREVLLETTRLLDEIVVIDSDSADATFNVATDAGARVFRSAEIRPDLGTHLGKGEAMWKAQLVTTGDLIVFMDADLTDWDTHFVPGLLGPLLTSPGVELVKGFYRRPFTGGDASQAGRGSFEGGRVTELVARPLLALHFPQLSGLVQPLAGEWAISRRLLGALPVPTGYAVELAALIDTCTSRGLDSIAQVDLGHRAHRHQSLRDLGAMATQICAAVQRRVGGLDVDAVPLRQYVPTAELTSAELTSAELTSAEMTGGAGAGAVAGGLSLVHRSVPVTERPPVATLPTPDPARSVARRFVGDAGPR